MLLADRDADAVLAPGPASEIVVTSALPDGAKTFRRHRFGLIIGSVVFATLAVSGYITYRQVWINDPSVPAPQVLPTAPARATAKTEDADQDVVKPPEAASAVSAAVKRQKPTNAAAGIERQPPSLGACTEAIAALGLCIRKSMQPGTATSAAKVTSTAAARPPANKEGADRGAVKPPEAASAVAAAVKRRDTTNAAATIKRHTRSLGPCTEAIAALGLCTPESTQPRK